MRVLLAVLAACSLLALVPAGSAEPVECDVDDDLYNHCHAGPVHWVTGPRCAGVAVDERAECEEVLDPR